MVQGPRMSRYRPNSLQDSFYDDVIPFRASEWYSYDSSRPEGADMRIDWGLKTVNGVPAKQ